MTAERWCDLCIRLGAAGPAVEDAFHSVASAYGEPGRHYHTAQHIEECLILFDELRHLAADPDAVEMAIWLHDVVYRPRRSDNEERSADFARELLAGLGVATPAISRIAELILATRHGSEPAPPGDVALLLDIDLQILGADRDRYEEYEHQVRREYRWVPGILFRRKRAEILEGFLSRGSIYLTEVCRARFEERARDNLHWAVARLR